MLELESLLRRQVLPQTRIARNCQSTEQVEDKFLSFLTVVGYLAICAVLRHIVLRKRVRISVSSIYHLRSFRLK